MITSYHQCHIPGTERLYDYLRAGEETLKDVKKKNNRC